MPLYMRGTVKREACKYGTVNKCVRACACMIAYVSNVVTLDTKQQPVCCKRLNSALMLFRLCK